MIRHLQGVLDAAQLAELRSAIADVRFEDGRMTNRGTRSKHNLQVPQNDPSMEAPGRIVRDALFRHPGFARWALPKQVSRPMISRYDEGMYYGRHSDEAMFPSTPPMRSDLSCTVFISEPDEYDGGELKLYLGDHPVTVKHAAGDAVLYPTDAIHEVTKVTRGARLVGILWVQSRVPDARKRELLTRLYGVMDKVLTSEDEDLKIEVDWIRSNLTRMWTEM